MTTLRPRSQSVLVPADPTDASVALPSDPDGGVSAGRQEIEIAVGRGYRPSTILAHADMPIRLYLRREDDDACTERVIFSSPRMERRLSSRGMTTIDLPAHPAGEIRFTCGMGRYQGFIRMEAPPSSWLARLARSVREVTPAPVIVTIVWMLAALGMARIASANVEQVEAIAGLVVVLFSALAGSLWAIRRSRRTGSTSMADALRSDRSTATHPR